MDEKKQKILQAASQVFSSGGYHKAKITKIAEIAGVGAGTVYLYFKNKESILEELFVNAWSRIDEKLVAMASIKMMSPRQKMQEILNEIVEMVIQSPDMAKMILHEYIFWSEGPSGEVNKIVDNVKRLVSDIIREGIAKGDFSKKLNCEDATTFIIGGIWHFMALRSSQTENWQASTLAAELEQLVLNGLS